MNRPKIIPNAITITSLILVLPIAFFIVEESYHFALLLLPWLVCCGDDSFRRYLLSLALVGATCRRSALERDYLNRGL